MSRRWECDRFGVDGQVKPEVRFVRQQVSLALHLLEVRVDDLHKLVEAIKQNEGIFFFLIVSFIF